MKRVRSVRMVFNHVRFGNDILARRLELRMSGEEVASLVEVEKTTVYKYERATEPSPKIRHFLAMCNLYDLDPREYFELER
jgi:transcriptional regulator with XRE-family HTH domain